jgi:YidC/Oxa1 family membrane protein insertase
LDIGQIWSVGVVGTLVAALQWLNESLVAVGLSGSLISSWALTIILFTVVVKLATLPLTLQQLRSSKKMQEIQPQLQALQKQYGKDREKLTQEQMRLYKENNVNPAAGCLPMLVQMPIWIGLYQALYHLAGTPEFANSHFLWIANLAHPEIFNPANPTANPTSLIFGWPPHIPILALLTGVTQWVVQKMMTPPSNDPQQQMMQSMMQFMPLMFIVFSLSVPSGLVLYWVTSNVFSMIQQYFITGWGSLKPTPAVAGASGAAPARQSEARLPSRAAAGLSATPTANGHSDELSAVQRAIPQAPPGARKRRRRGK